MGTTNAKRSRLARLAASGLVLSGLLPLAGAEPAPSACDPAPCCGTACCDKGSLWQRFWDHFRDPCATIPPGALPAPNGSAVRAWEGLMIDRAADDQFVVCLHEWYMGSGFLGPYGCTHVKRIAALLPRQPAVVVVQPAPSPELNESRRMLLVRLLQREGVVDAEARVVVGFPAAEGLSAAEAARAYDRGQDGCNAGGR